MAAEGGCIDFMFLAPPTRPLDPPLGSFIKFYLQSSENNYALKTVHK